MFTWLIMTIAVAAAGAANILLACRDREFLGALQYLLCSVALTMGYLSLA